VEEAEVLDQLLDESPDPETERELRSALDALEADVGKLELASLLGGEYDRNDAVASLHACAGGT
jgi:peptide chain release factor 2